MSRNFMHYDKLMQDALRGVVREALKRVAESGLPGSHHFYIAFRTDHPGVGLSEALKSRYPHEMTIVLQHEFWGLDVRDAFFEVGLKFNRAPERLHIPFAAVKGFYDPSVKFGLEFAVEDVPPLPLPARSEADEKPVESASDAPAEAKPGAVVSLDSFRKKS